MSAGVIIEDAVGVVDGFNDVFETTLPYTPGSLSVFLNGQLKKPSLVDGWDELGGKQFRMKEIPLVGDTIRVYYTY